MTIPDKIREAIGLHSKTQPTRAELARDVDLFLKDCKCDVDGHTIKIRLNGYAYIITRSVEETKK